MPPDVKDAARLGDMLDAARHVSPDERNAYSNIPWSSIIGLRNVIAHEDGEIQYEKIWLVCTDRLPILMEQLELAGIEDPPF